MATEEILTDGFANDDNHMDNNYNSNSEKNGDSDENGEENYDSNSDQNSQWDENAIPVVETECEGINRSGSENLNKGSPRAFQNWCIEDGISINGLIDVLNMDMTSISPADVAKYDFLNLEMAFMFYSWYGRFNGFSPRKDCVVKNKNGDLLQQTFVCSRSGYRVTRLIRDTNKRRGQRNDTRCGCEAKFRVHIDLHSSRWYVTLFADEHNHQLLPASHCSLLPTHRKMTAADILLIESFTKVGIRAPHVYGSFANSCGGYDKVGFILKDIYNQVARQKKRETSDANESVRYLQQLREKDPLMYVTHTIDENGRLEHLFWSDGESQMNYKIFGDVLAFDATYKKNRYQCPVVIFSGVNHHNQTTVFATALVSNEEEATYVWLLEQFLNVMKKSPISVITDGCGQMKAAINKVFPGAHHRLCAWHLQRNAIRNIGIPEFMPYFNKCMLGDYDVSRFEMLWEEMVTKFGLEGNSWIMEMYSKRKMWATSHIRGNFFAGIRTTSRCEALHCHMGKYVNSRMSLTDFVEQFQRCLTYFRFREVEADFKSNYGDAVLETNIPLIEASASRLFTKEILMLFRKVLNKVQSVAVGDCHETSMYKIYTVSRYCDRSRVWQVAFCQDSVEFRCSCLRMESRGLPCEHILVVMLWLDFTELPKTLVLNRFSKNAKQSVRGSQTEGSYYWDSHVFARYANLIQLCKELCEVVYRDDEHYNRVVDIVVAELVKYKDKNKNKNNPVRSTTNLAAEPIEDQLQNPPVVRTKGCGRRGGSTSARPRSIRRCSICGKTGHNRRSCPILVEHNAAAKAPVDGDHDLGSGSEVEGFEDYTESQQVDDDADDVEDNATMMTQEGNPTNMFTASCSRAYA